ncbi:MAG: antibiotic biosynthesis monooxygenase [Candidatus Binataceae bacterium]
MIVAVSRFKVGAVEAARLEARFRSRPRLVDVHDGFLGLEVLRTIGREPIFMLVTRWTDRAALKRYMRSPDFRAVHQGNEEDGADFSICEVVTAT